MGFETIKKEFIKVLKKELIKKKASYKKAINFKEIAEKFKDTGDVGKFIVDNLNKVLEENNINFSDKEKGSFFDYIKSTIDEYISKFLKETI